MPSIPNIPEFPKTWDMLLFVVGAGFIFFNQGNKWFILLGTFFLGVGIIIALAYPLATMMLNKYPTDEEVKDWVQGYVFLAAFILLCILIVIGMILFLPR